MKIFLKLISTVFPTPCSGRMTSSTLSMAYRNQSGSLVSRSLLAQAVARPNAPKALLIWIFCCTLLLTCVNSAYADESFFDLRLGAKGGITGLLWSAPDNTPVAFNNMKPFWGDDQFYIGGGIGPFIELHLLRYLGLEMDLLYEANAFTFNQTYNVGGLSVEYDYNTHFQQLRLPILIKGVLPLADTAEMSLGLGPEFVFGTGGSVEIDRRTDLGVLNSQTEESLLDLYNTEETGGVFFDFDLGVAIKVWRLIIPIDLRVGINLDQPTDYNERVDVNYDAAILRATVKAIESYNFALLLGVGYVFDFSDTADEAQNASLAAP